MRRRHTAEAVDDGGDSAQQGPQDAVGSWSERRGGIGRYSLDVVMLLWEKAVSLLEEDMDGSAAKAEEVSDEADVLLSGIVTSVNIYILATCLAFSCSLVLPTL
eukprot:TRINITY_DN9537_c0_g1_i1.p1 TRINITY_DN9537_c0_g1~~TRINITY_DN9537_c0_g1_i1.p1  ORF type:complete len:104 (+),score=17.16 TRINITY_DN9537_c0_g1_i1:37-348(+)